MDLETPFFFLYIVAAFWVYDDAKKRGMDAWTYALLTLVIPVLGFIYYWIRRDEFYLHSKAPDKPSKPKVCPDCRWANEEINQFCSRCGYKFSIEYFGSTVNLSDDVEFGENLSKANLKECKSCGNVFAGTLDSCPRCGSKI